MMDTIGLSPPIGEKSAILGVKTANLRRKKWKMPLTLQIYWYFDKNSEVFPVTKAAHQVVISKYFE